MAYFDLDLFEFHDIDEYDDEWIDEYTYYDEYDYRDEKEAFWASHYSKVLYSLPDSISILRVSHPHKKADTGIHVTYENLHAVITKIESLFLLWQKRLVHDWNKDVKRPLDNDKEVVESNKEAAKCEASETTKDTEKSKDDDNNPNNDTANNHAHDHAEGFFLAHAIQALAEYEVLGLGDDFPPLFSDDDDSCEFDGDSDDFDSSLDDYYDYSDEDDLKAHKMRKEARKNKRKKSQITEGMEAYQLSARQFYDSFPKVEDAEAILSQIISMRSWILDLFISTLEKCTGQALPQLVFENILKNLTHQSGQLHINIGFVAKTVKFIDVEKLRMNELYTALLEIYSLFFEILFHKHHLTANTTFLKEYIQKLFQVAMRKFVMLEELHAWLLGNDESAADNDNQKTGFMSGVFHCKLLKSCGRDFDYWQPLNEAFASFDGKHLAVLAPGGVKEGCVKIYDVNSYHCSLSHNLSKDEIALGMSLKDNKLVLLLKRGLSCHLAIIYFLHKSKAQELKLDVAVSSKEAVRKMIFVEFEDQKRLIAQFADDIIVIDLGGESKSNPAVIKTYKETELLAAKGQYIIAQDIERSPLFTAISTAKEFAEIKKKVTGIKVFDLKEDALLKVIKHLPEKDENSLILSRRQWSATIDTDPDSFRFLLWSYSAAQLWEIGDGVTKLKDIDLSDRVRNGLKLALHKNIIAVLSTQNSHHDTNYDTIKLSEILFHDMATSQICYHETYHGTFEKPACNISTPGGHIYGLHIAENVLISLHSSSNGGEVRISKFDISHQKIIGMECAELLEKRREEELKRQIREAERKRSNEERARKREEQRQKRLEKKRKQRNAQRKYREKAEKADKLRNLTQSGVYVIGEVSEWRGSYGFLEIAGFGSAFVHITDIHGRPFLTPGCRIHCQLQEQVGHPRPKAINASLMRY